MQAPETVEGFSRRKNDHSTQLRDSLSGRLLAIGKNLQTVDKQVLELAAQTLARDEAENASMIDELVRAGYRDVGSRVNSALIKRLLGYITPL
jgi:hypothetical protein